MATWQQFQSEAGTRAAWHKRNIPYQHDANALQNLEIWIPAAAHESDPPSDDGPPSPTGTWIVYIHGGAWRDPEVDSSTFVPTVKHLLNNAHAMEKLGGIASINYSLSPYPSHPRNPSPPSDPQQPADPSRQALHPQHLADVGSALGYLHNRYGFGSNYILLGHSCGATLAFQACIGMSEDVNCTELVDLSLIRKPKLIVGLNGLYNLYSLVMDPGPKHEHLAPIYGDFVSRAFQIDKELLRDISPIRWANTWGRLLGVRALLSQSREDTLVPYSQTREMLDEIINNNDPDFVNDCCTEVSITGDHNEIWEKGSELARIIRDALLVPEANK